MPDRAAGAHVDARLRAALEQEQQDPALVGRELVEDPVEGRVPLVGVPHVARAVEQLGAAVAQRRGLRLVDRRRR